MVITETQVFDYINDLYQEFPKLSVKRQRPWWLRWAFKAMFWQPYEEWDRFTSTIGMNIFLAPDWDSFSAKSRLKILVHEREHLKQFKKYGPILMGLIYLLLPLPVGLALGRAHFERAGYDAGLEFSIKNEDLSDEVKDFYRAQYIEHFTGPYYFWMFPFPSIVGKWFDKTWDRVKSSLSSPN